MADIFDEIEEELKQDRLASLWSKYGLYLIAGVIAIIAIVAGRQGYVAWQYSTAQTAADKYHQALDADDIVLALNDIQAELPSGYQMLAQFRAAAELASSGQPAAAEQAYLVLSEDDGIDSLYRDIALVLSVMNAADDADSAQLLDRLAPLATTANILQGLALELSAGLEIRRNNIAAAIENLNQIETLTEVPPAIRARSAQLVSIISENQD